MRPVAGAILAVVLMAVGSPSESRTHHGRELPDGPFPVVAGVTPIQDVNANDASGFSPLEFQTVTIEGVVQLGTGGIDPFDASGASTWFYVSDGTGGVAVAEAGQVVTPVSAGEHVRVTGLVLTQGVVPLRGTRTIDLAFGGSVQSIGSGTTDSPTGITASQLLTDGAAWEGTRVRIGGLTLVDPGEWPGPGASGFVRVRAVSTR